MKDAPSTSYVLEQSSRAAFEPKCNGVEQSRTSYWTAATSRTIRCAETAWTARWLDWTLWQFSWPTPGSVIRHSGSVIWHSGSVWLRDDREHTKSRHWHEWPYNGRKPPSCGQYRPQSSNDSVS